MLTKMSLNHSLSLLLQRHSGLLILSDRIQRAIARLSKEIVSKKDREVVSVFRDFIILKVAILFDDRDDISIKGILGLALLKHVLPVEKYSILLQKYYDFVKSYSTEISRIKKNRNLSIAHISSGEQLGFGSNARSLVDFLNNLSGKKEYLVTKKEEQAYIFPRDLVDMKLIKDFSAIHNYIKLLHIEFASLLTNLMS